MKTDIPTWNWIEDSTYESHKACLSSIPENTPIYALVEYADAANGDRDENAPVVARVRIRRNPEGSLSLFSWFFLYRAGDISSHEDEELMAPGTYVVAWRAIQ